MFNLLNNYYTNFTASSMFMSIHVRRIRARWSVYTLAPARRTCTLFSACLKQRKCTPYMCDECLHYHTMHVRRTLYGVQVR